VILDVNKEWKQFAVANNYKRENFGVGSNYIETCKNATGDCAAGSEQAAEICLSVLSGKASYCEMEYPCHSPTEERWFILQVNSLEGEQGGAVISHIEISSRKKAEILLKNSEEFSHSIFGNSPDCVKILNPDGTFHSMNVNGLCVMEIDDLKPFVGRVWTDFWEGEGHTAANEAIKKAREGKVGHFEGLCKTVKGKLKYCSVSVAPVFDSEGKLRRFISTSRDADSKAAPYVGKLDLSQKQII
jgi:PAS domain-containing protein